VNVRLDTVRLKRFQRGCQQIMRWATTTGTEMNAILRAILWKRRSKVCWHEETIVHWIEPTAALQKLLVDWVALVAGLATYVLDTKPLWVPISILACNWTPRCKRCNRYEDCRLPNLQTKLWCRPNVSSRVLVAESESSFSIRNFHCADLVQPV